MTPLQRSTLLKIVENIYPRYYSGQADDPSERGAKSKTAADPNTDPNTLLALTSQYPTQVWNNIVLPLVALEDPAMFQQIQQRYLTAMERNKALERTHSDARLGVDAWFKQLAFQYASKFLLDFEHELDNNHEYADIASWPDPSEDWEFDSDYVDFTRDYNIRFGRYPTNDEVSQKFMQKAIDLFLEMVDLKKQYAPRKTNAQSTQLAIAHMRWSIAKR